VGAGKRRKDLFMIPDAARSDQANSVLLPHHLTQLTEGSGISLDIIQARGYRSIHGPGCYSELKPFGFTRVQAGLAPGLLIPILDIDGQAVLYQFKPDTPRKDDRGKSIKYETPAKAAMRLDMGVGQQELLKDPQVPLWIGEGIKKTDAMRTHGLCAVVLLGVWNFKGKNAYGGVTLLADWDLIALNRRQVRIVFDSDVMTKPPVRKALDRLTAHLQRKGAHVVAVYLPTEGGQKVGVDDYLRTHSVQDLEGLIEAPRPQPEPAKPIIRLLDHFPNVMTKPLQLIDGHSYATTWLPLEITRTEVPGKAGEIVHLAQPLVSIERHRFLVREDGTLFADVPDPVVQPIQALGFALACGDAQSNDRLWSPPGVKAYRTGRNPQPATTFEQVVRVYDHFIDFRGSLAEQNTMCEVSACLTLMTWFADAFTVLPYPWATSPGPGSGKTKWGICWTKTSYLGYQTTMGGTFSALRDLAEAGATLLFDDAEIISELEEVDPDKRELVLAGNRKGVQIPVKEPVVGGAWRIKWMNAYCPRGFTAIGLPTGALETRCIVMPFLKTDDPTRGNRDPASEETWPVNRRRLIDALWALALSLLSEAAQIWRGLADERELMGRAFEPWRAVIAIAKLLEKHGAVELESRMRATMLAYQTQKQTFLPADPIALVIQAVLRLIPDVADVADVLTFLCETPREHRFKTSEITKEVFRLAKDYDVGVELGEHPGKKIGHLLSKLRFVKADEEDSRGWKIKGPELVRLAKAYGISTIVTSERPLSQENVRTSGTSGTSARCPSCGGREWQTIPGGDAVCVACARQAG